MLHDHYYEIAAETPYELGLKRGELFGDVARETLIRNKYERTWLKKLELSQASFTLTQRHFPQLIEELKGYAEGSHISLSDFWTMSLEDDFDDVDKCTTIVTNNGLLISHNEDWDEVSEDNICVLKKSLRGVTTFELFYYNTLGGASACINSYGISMMINTLTHTDRQIGVPRNVIARWLSETKNPEADFEKMKDIPRSLGYDHIFASSKGQVWNIESSATAQVLEKPDLPFVHTNHFLTKELVGFEENDDSTGTYERYEQACKNVREKMTVDELISLNSTTNNNEKDSIMNNRTIGRMVIDFAGRVAKIWLKREKEKGWVDYPLEFLPVASV